MDGQNTMLNHAISSTDGMVQSNKQIVIQKVKTHCLFVFCVLIQCISCGQSAVMSLPYKVSSLKSVCVCECTCLNVYMCV